jgi:predicted Rossmann-fold nucleotide-binding protein
LEEFCEILTWAQLGLHQKPCGVVNAAGYFDHLMVFLDHAVRERFLRPEHRRMVLVEADPEELLDRFEAYRPPQLEKWIDRGTS